MEAIIIASGNSESQGVSYGVDFSVAVSYCKEINGRRVGLGCASRHGAS